MEQFVLKPLMLGDTPLAFTNSALFMTFAVLGTLALFWVGTRHRTMVPSRWQSVSEMLYEFVGSMVKENVGNEGRPYFPFIFTLFMF
ncbi:MAG: F0F1 ATP synthase subunit A, partial [Rhodobacteraceae bacterium]|nr:F0F1 ATP synthase subunit A [Paracoccaceae bacterium]